MSSRSNVILAPAPISFHQLLTNRLQIPLYQRFYDWDEELVDQLIADLLKAFKFGKNIYLGSIIVRNEKNRVHVIDGQQRLLTLIMMLRAICDLCRIQRKFKLLKTIDDILRKTNIQFKEATIIELNEDQQKVFFNQYILRDTDLETIEKTYQQSGAIFSKTRSRIYLQLEKQLKKEKIGLDSLFSYIDHRIEFIKIVLSPTANEAEIFDAINSKRQELATIDKIKGQLFKLTPHYNWNKIGTCWDEIRAGFKSTTDFETFIGYFATASNSDDEVDFNVRKPRALLKFFQNKIGINRKKTTNSFVSIKRLFAEMEKYKEAYLILTNPDHSKLLANSKAARAMQASVHFQNKYRFSSHLPLVMRASVENKKTVHSTILKLLTICEFIHYRDRLRDALPQSTKDIFNKKLLVLKQSRPTTILKKLKQDAERKKTTGEIATLSQQQANWERLTRYLLHRIISRNEPQRLSYTFRHLEHIHPQTQTKEWESVMIRDIKKIKWNLIDLGKKPSDLQKKKYYSSRYIYSLGNCALFLDIANEAVKNDNFEKKLAAYRKEDENLTLGWVKKHSTGGWTFRKIEGNGKHLATQFVDILFR